MFVMNLDTTRIWSSPYDGQIRLQDSLYTNQGLVEVYCNGQWGTVCDDLFGKSEADTVCRQLGYTGAAAYDNLTSWAIKACYLKLSLASLIFNTHSRGSSNQPTWLDDVDCAINGSSCIQSCQMCPSRQIHNCGHAEDITIECGKVEKWLHHSYSILLHRQPPSSIYNSIHNLRIAPLNKWGVAAATYR